MHKLGLKLWSVNTDHYLSEARRLYELGVFDYLELYVVPGSLNALTLWKNLDIPYIIHCPHFAHGFNLADSAKRAFNADIYSEVKRFADALKARYIIFHGGVDHCIEETAAQLAAFHEPRALLENKPMRALPKLMGGRYCRGYSVQEIRYVQDVAHCGFCLDIGHAVCSANSQGIEAYSYIQDFSRLQPTMVHLSDVADMSSEYDAHPHLGTGELDLQRVISLLPQDCPVSLETIKSSPSDLDDFAEDVRIFRECAPIYRIRSATEADIKSVFDLSNDPVVRKSSIHCEPIAWDCHVTWYASRLLRSESPFFIIEHDATGDFIGQLRLDQQDDGSMLISLSIASEWRGKGIGSSVIRRAIQMTDSKMVTAMIREDNASSRRSFEKAGFNLTDVVSGFAHYTYKAES